MNNDMDKYVNSVKGFNRISHEREKELSTIINSDDPIKARLAREEMIQSNLMLVVSRAIKMHLHFSFLRIDVMDFIAEGNIGLVRAAEIYKGNHESGATFGSYAVKCIDSKMLDVLKAVSFIYTPSYYFKFKKQLDNMREENSSLTEEEIIKELDISKETLDALKRHESRKVTSLEGLSINEDGESGWADRHIPSICFGLLQKRMGYHWGSSMRLHVA